MQMSVPISSVKGQKNNCSFAMGKATIHYSNLLNEKRSELNTIINLPKHKWAIYDYVNDV